MFLFESLNFAQLGDTYLFAIKEGDFWFLAFASLLLGMASVWLARRPQPVPDRDAWKS